MNYDFTIIVPVYNELGSLNRLEQLLNTYFQKDSNKEFLTLKLGKSNLKSSNQIDM